MKVLFLDHDGVICLNKNFGTRFKKGKVLKFSQSQMDKPVIYRFDDFDKKAITVLNQIIEESDCEIVVSSDWKLWATVEEMGEYYESQGIIKKPLDFTPSLSDVTVPSDFVWSRDFDLEQTRSLEIKGFLTTHPEITHWVAVDDLHRGITQLQRDSNIVWGLDNFVWCPSVYEGIKQTGVKEKLLKFFE